MVLRGDGSRVTMRATDARAKWLTRNEKKRRQGGRQRWTSAPRYSRRLRHPILLPSLIQRVALVCASPRRFLGPRSSCYQALTSKGRSSSAAPASLGKRRLLLFFLWTLTRASWLQMSAMEQMRSEGGGAGRSPGLRCGAARCLGAQQHTAQSAMVLQPVASEKKWKAQRENGEWPKRVLQPPSL